MRNKPWNCKLTRSAAPWNWTLVTMFSWSYNHTGLQSSVALRKHQKLGLHHFGPFPVIARVGIPPTAKIHPVFHISQLKVFEGPDTASYIPLSLNTSTLGLIMQPDVVLQSRVIIKDVTPVPRVLVKWMGLDYASATWEDKADMKLNYPNLNLEDKVSFDRPCRTATFS